MTLVLPLVPLVHQNVSDVLDQLTTVLIVNGQEKMLHTVNAHPDLSMMEPVNAKSVLINVKLVKKKLKTVSFVLPTELTLQTVTVKLLSSILLENQNVSDVLINVTLVPHVDLVPLVTPQESMPHNVTVLMV